MGCRVRMMVSLAPVRVNLVTLDVNTLLYSHQTHNRALPGLCLVLALVLKGKNKKPYAEKILKAEKYSTKYNIQ